MFDLRSQEYERCIFASVLQLQQVQVLHRSLQVGTPFELSKHTPVVSSASHETDASVPYTSSHSFHLNQCVAIERMFSSVRTNDVTPQVARHASSAQQRQQQTAITLNIQRTASDDTLDPSSKRLVVCDMLRQLLSLTEANIDWSSVGELVSLLLALDRLIVGDDSVEVLLDELDLAVVNCCLHRYDHAHLHATRASAALSRIEPQHFSSTLVQKRLLLVKSIANLETNPILASQYSAEAVALNEDNHYVYHVVHLAATLAGPDANSSPLVETTLQQAKSLCEVAAGYLCVILPYLNMLHMLDTNLRVPEVRSALLAEPEKLLSRLAHARTSEIAAINAELDKVKQRSDEHHAKCLSLITVGNKIIDIIQQCFDRAAKLVVSPDGLRSFCSIAFVFFRMTSLINYRDASKERLYDSVAARAVGDVLGLRWGFMAACDGLSLCSGRDIFSQNVSYRALMQSTMPSPYKEAANDASVRLLTDLCNAVAASTKPTRTQRDPVEELHSWQALGEEILVMLYDDSSDTFSDDIIRCRFASLLAAVNKRLCSTTSEKRLCAVEAALLSRIKGPTSQQAIAAVAKYQALLQCIDAPTASPAWGVRTLHDQITLHCNTPYAEIFYSISHATGHSAQHCFRYEGPIVLDQPGRQTLRAFAEKDKVRSVAIETHYFVQSS